MGRIHVFAEILLHLFCLHLQRLHSFFVGIRWVIFQGVFCVGFQFLHHSNLSFSMFFARICNLFVIFCKLLSCFKFQPTSGQILKDFSKFRQIYGQLFIRELFLRVEYVDVDSRLRVRAITRTRQSTRNQQPKLGTVSPRPSALKRR